MSCWAISLDGNNSPPVEVGMVEGWRGEGWQGEGQGNGRMTGWQVRAIGFDYYYYYYYHYYYYYDDYYYYYYY